MAGMEQHISEQHICSEKLLEIINIQNDIAQIGVDFEKLAFLIADRSMDITDSDGAVVELLEEDELVYRATAGIADKQLGLRLKSHGSLSGFCARTSEPQKCDDSETDQRVDRIACRKVGLRSMLLVPLVFGETSIGVLKVFSSRSHAYSAKELYILKLLSRMFCAVLYSADRLRSDELYLNATTDTLTGIKNRSVFYDRLRIDHQMSRESSPLFGVFIADMDNLKIINDSLGHILGDRAIIEVANRIKAVIRENSTFCRIGGDEFGIIVYGVHTAEEMEKLKRRITSSVHRPCEIASHKITLSISIGYALSSRSGSDIDKLVEAADKRMYEDKRQRR
ncbi:diguanylate cyclase domain-containing protein [Spirochaeta dissipatitropha]